MKKFILNSFVALSAILSMASCKSYYYQVYNVSSDNVKQQDNSLVYENEDCKVLYNLWSNNGKLKFAIVNKTDKDIFVNMGQSFYVVNGRAVDYYQERSYTQQDFYLASYTNTTATAYSKGSGFSWGNDIYMENASAVAGVNTSKLARTSSKSVTVKEQEVVCVPAKCYKVFGYYEVNPEWKKTCVKENDFPKNIYQVGTYTKANSPVSFKNRIAYGFTKSDVADKHIDNDFWISSITNYSQKAASEKVKEKGECYGVKSSSESRLFKIGGPDKFYKLILNDGRY